MRRFDSAPAGLAGPQTVGWGPPSGWTALRLGLGMVGDRRSVINDRFVDRSSMIDPRSFVIGDL